MNKVDFSTYLNDNKILLRVHNRFMLFESDGRFIDEVEFKNDSLISIEQQVMQRKKPPMNITKFREQTKMLGFANNDTEKVYL